MNVNIDYTLEAYVFKDLKKMPIKKVLENPRWVLDLVEKHKKRPALVKPQDALVIGGLSIMYVIMAQSGTISIYNTGHTNVNISNNSAYTVAAGAGNNAYGIQLGLSDTAVAMADYVLTSLIAHGTAPNNLSYGACSTWESVNSAAKCEFVIARTFVNNSGGDVLVKECGLTVWSSGVNYYLWCHDLTGGITVTNGGAALFLYRQTLT